MGNTLLLLHKIVSQPSHCFGKSQKSNNSEGKRSLLSVMRKWQKGFCTIFISKTFDVIHLSPVILSQKIAQRGISRIHCMFSLSFL